MFTNQLTLEHIHMTFEGKRLSDFRETLFANSPRVNQILDRVDSLICAPKKQQGEKRKR